MASNSGRKYGSSGRSSSRKRVVIGADETVRVRYKRNQPEVEAERRLTPRQTARKAGGSSGGGRSRSSYQGKRISAAKREERERRQMVIRLRRAAAAVVAVVAVSLVVWGVVALYRAPVFEVRSIVVTGADRLGRSAILELAGIRRSETLLRVPIGEIQRRIESSPWVSEASVERDFPSTVRLNIRERRPAAIVDAGGTNLWMISADGYWLGERSAEDTDALVIRDIEGVHPAAGERTKSPELLNAIKVVTGISQELRSMTRAVSVPTIEKTALITNDDVEVFIGSASQLSAKDRIVRGILQSKKGEVVYINVRVVGSPIWRGLTEAP